MAPDKDTNGLMAEGVPVDPDPQREADLIAELNRGDGNPGKAAVDLARLCARTGRQRSALPHVEHAADTAPDPEARAKLRLVCGQLMEQLGDFEAAITHYERGLAGPITSVKTRYFLHNNLGFCLNEQARHAEAEAHCEKAIEIEPRSHNAYKNRAIALEYLNDWHGAAVHFAAAAQLAPSDPRALMHLNRLLEAHPEVYDEVEDLRSWHDELLSHDRELRKRMN